MLNVECSLCLLAWASASEGGIAVDTAPPPFDEVVLSSCTDGECALHDRGVLLVCVTGESLDW